MKVPRPPKIIGSRLDRKWRESLTRKSESTDALQVQPFIVAEATNFLGAERVLTGTDNISVVDAGPDATITLDLTPTGVTAATYFNFIVDAKGRITSAFPVTTDNLAEGATNLYFTVPRVLAALPTPTIFIGETVTSGTNKSVLYVNASGQLGQDPNFQYDEGTATLSIINEIINGALSLPILTQGSILFMNGGVVSEDPGVFSYDFANEIFYAILQCYLGTWGNSTSNANGNGGAGVVISCGQNIDVTTDNLVAGAGAQSHISCGGRATGSTDNTGTPAAGGDASVCFISVGGASEVAQGCTSGIQGNGGTVFIASGAQNVANDTFGVAGSVYLCGIVDEIGGLGGATTGTFSSYASTNSFYGGVDFFSSVFASTFEIGTLTVRNRIDLNDNTTGGNVPTPLLINRYYSVSGEYSGQIIFAGSDTSTNALLMGQVVGDYDTGYFYLSYPNQFGGVGGSFNPAIVTIPASTGAVAGHVRNHVGINCFPTDADYDLQFNTNGYGIGRQRQAAGSGADLGDWLISAGSPSINQTNVSGGNLKLRSGLTTGNRATEVLLEVFAAAGSGMADNAAVEGFAASSTGIRSRYKWGKFNNVTTAGYGMPAIYGNTRLTAKTTAQTVSTTAVGAADGSFEVSANVLVTTSTLHAFTVTCSYTDEGNTARVLTLQFSNLAGTMLTSIANAAGAVPYEGAILHIRAKASTNIVIASTGTFTTVTYNIESMVKQTA